MTKRFVVWTLSILYVSLLQPIQPAHAELSSPATVCVVNTCTVSFPFASDYYAWNAPAATTYTVEVWGAQGGNANLSGSVITYGGKGGYAKGDIALNINQTIYIYVGGQGEGETSTAISTVQPGGFNGGGAGYNGSSTSNYRGAGGGGATDIRVGGIQLSNRIIVGGGGAGGAYYSAYSTNYPGVGGGTVGGDGSTANYSAVQTYNGKGGTSTAGGVGGSNGGVAGSGTSGSGGAGVIHGYGSGGGGGGYFGGGGGGTGMGAGGGSGYVGGVTNTTLTAGSASMPNPAGGTMTGRTGNGYAKITYTWATSNVSLSVAGGAITAFKGQSIGIVANVDYAGRVTFFADNKKIAGCISLLASVGTKTCNWKPTTQKLVKLTVTLNPFAASSSTSSEIVLNIAKRINTR